ncbi:TonB-dependent receptor [Aureispira anguillae]|uniref:Carboxypeptidase-like regulatory domain-containing protein n=1 Tax=Aureispira anguillae TaxID=2864201 RepID=A0A916DTR5_9BACT|nr:carboxypeptidase-like regulatory domain-containing protein [Aureispira anguillae]BDS11681.1 carboxypeptidase-like regulatory domain-containing protein [Aureispira anguillae]
MKYLFCLFLYLTSSFILVAQDDKTQTIRGKVVDHASQMPLIGVVLMVSETNINSVSDENGNFVLEQVPLGRQTINAQYLGYEPYTSEDLIISSSKEPYLDILLKEQVEVTETVVVKASKGADGVGNQALNDLSVVSTRSFSVEETKRYAASIDDPGRMAAALPGVQSDQDNENDVIIRGNSSAGVLWRLEGLEITNPTHFARPASTGGGITVFSAALLGNTDFSTGGFAAEYGNAFSGVFDMRFRKGNMTQREHSAKIGLVGLGFATEGPMKKGRSSYLINYRYSTLGVLNAMGLYVVRENASNNFQDLSFCFTFNSKDNKNEFKIFGVGGNSDELWWVKEDTADWQNNWDYQYEKAGSNLGVLGLSYRRLINEKSYLKATVGSVFSHIFSTQYEPEITNLENRDTFEVYDFKILRTQAHLTYSYKFSNQFRLKAGGLFHAISHWLNLSERRPTDAVNQQYLALGDANTDILLQGYAQGSYRPTSQLTINAGVHAMYFAMNNTYSIEPRLSVQYKPFSKTTLSAAYGLHGKVIPIGTYYLRIKDQQGNYSQPNKNLKIAKWHHAILSYQQVIGLGFRATLEAYYQYGFDIPTSPDSSSTYWLFNERQAYGYEAMISEGQAQNYGIDMTLEKAFGRNFFILLTGSIYQSQYKSLGDTEWRNTRVNKGWGTSLMGGYEFVFKKGGVLQVGLKNFLAGGIRYTPADEAASKTAGALIEDSNNAFGAQAPIYFRLDTRIAYRKDHKKLSYTIALDIQNVANHKNIIYYAYDRQKNSLFPRYQSGLLPVISIQIDF